MNRGINVEWNKLFLKLVNTRSVVHCMQWCSCATAGVRLSLRTGTGDCKTRTCMHWDRQRAKQESWKRLEMIERGLRAECVLKQDWISPGLSLPSVLCGPTCGLWGLHTTAFVACVHNLHRLPQHGYKKSELNQSLVKISQPTEYFCCWTWSLK